MDSYVTASFTYSQLLLIKQYFYLPFFLIANFYYNLLRVMKVLNSLRFSSKLRSSCSLLIVFISFATYTVFISSATYKNSWSKVISSLYLKSRIKYKFLFDYVNRRKQRNTIHFAHIVWFVNIYIFLCILFYT